MATRPALPLKKGDQFVIGLDRSHAMLLTDTPTGQARFAYALEAAGAYIRDAEAFDVDGVSVYAFAESVHVFENVHSTGLGLLGLVVQPGDSPDLAQAVEFAFAKHMGQRPNRTIAMFMVGAVPQGGDVEERLAWIAERAEPADFRVQILTVGEISVELGAYLLALDESSSFIDVRRLEGTSFKRAVEGILQD